MASEEDLALILRQAYPTVLAKILTQTKSLPDAEDAAQEAIIRALKRWPQDGVPDSPEAWLVTTAKNIGIDLFRRRRREQHHAHAVQELAQVSPWSFTNWSTPDRQAWDDDMLRLIFTCCDPVLALQEQSALTLSTVVGLSGPELANAFHVAPRTMEQRLVRARRRLQERRQEYAVPSKNDSETRENAVLQVLHLTFNEGYWSGTTTDPIRKDLCRLAFDLTHAVVAVLSQSAEARGLLSLLTFHHARLPARIDDDENPVRLEVQDRTQWDQTLIGAAQSSLDEAIAMRDPGPFQIEAAIAAQHTSAPTAATTDWRQIAALYQVLEQMRDSPLVRLNRSFAVAMAEGADKGLELLEPIAQHPAIKNNFFAHIVRAELLAKLGRDKEATAELHHAAARARNEPERKEVQRRLRLLSTELRLV